MRRRWAGSRPAWQRRSRSLGGDPARDPERPPAAGPVFVGGFAFASDGGSSPEWSSLAPASLVLPEVALARRDGEARMTVCVAVDGDEAPEAATERAVRRFGDLRPASVPLLDPDPVEPTKVASAAPPAHFEQAVDDHLGERMLQSAKEREELAIVARRIGRTLDPVSLWVAAAEQPMLVKVQNVQHLATPIRAQLADPMSAIELVELLHPTPAVGGEPRAAALPLIPALEGLDRGWYAGAVGWTDLAEDGEFCVALRCALLRGRVAHLYAGCGIVRDSVPAEELAESEVKLQALLPLLS